MLPIASAAFPCPRFVIVVLPAAEDQLAFTKVFGSAHTTLIACGFVLAAGSECLLIAAL